MPDGMKLILAATAIALISGCASAPSQTPEAQIDPESCGGGPEEARRAREAGRCPV
jgi:type IV pilus biogenesis protein CpaD/CtpE